MSKLLIHSSIAAICLMLTPVAHSASAVANATVKVSHHTSVATVDDLSFGDVSVNSMAGAVLINADGSRTAEGGVQLGGADSFSPARFVIDGLPNTTYELAFPNQVEMMDEHGNTIVVDQLNSDSLAMGEQAFSGSQTLNVGGRLNLDANQPVGVYSGTLFVDIIYR